MHKNPLFIILSIFTIAFFSVSYFLYNSLPTLSAFQPLSINDVVAVANVSAVQTDVPLVMTETRLPESEEVRRMAQAVKITDVSDPVLESGSAIVMDSESGKIIFSKDANRKSPIASITKLMTAMVFLENNPGWETEYKISQDDKVEGGKEYIYNGDIVKVKDLFYLSLVGSANSATLALVRSTGMSEKDFVVAMNKKADELNLKDTFFADPIGLSNYNVSSAYEVAKIAKAALADESIGSAVLSKEYGFETAGGRKIVVYSTDALLDSFPLGDVSLLGGKTGYTEAAGYCFVGKFSKDNGKEIISVVLGGSDIGYRFSKTQELIEWTYGNFDWVY
ncbi:MAG: D-alanyl-D-alanine carboxypeptidase [Candidatus Falkowbacteria bacterium GW2011_GWC2_38_22]|uniref:D-alanyl-D-alanine carboxypeptidase n=1 Tax=Candidatus Falkowbacteria bacterium GW2011_GWE1_38_31 TaxID=1618638 RepID=A0A0G0MX86_9BACT|nr:MAG: D-alanyl-D-alanine carboxypeptidase [Candidatus Falkowbacteria bacterium GW2011_GWF2_38_1205]KKQ60487.1 MAG: D-alanyl-D-alanine carboxypeptidase [Candidatus Falkowbacteria bacterium GW2011_GWC2_38_22]KKQ62585.1 MAG: D-alanyl-D-alanine carboxypeptidase [Candidatus Falkowbacteria bacterium GW2011_GWF1_38_22]KKQ64632.1 MAG: D-alanyl-D-alanine carboxypeptidase [Candidatus Falkowbacteria bacterium GW2011_GWE2_38_254]KKQ69541.1 MAG: D-alanyl-D-alanine carboxypeptidase [Candidatus Falkowbacter